MVISIICFLIKFFDLFDYVMLIVELDLEQIIGCFILLVD